MGVFTHQRRQQTDQQAPAAQRKRGTVLQDNRATAGQPAQRRDEPGLGKGAGRISGTANPVQGKFFRMMRVPVQPPPTLSSTAPQHGTSTAMPSAMPPTSLMPVYADTESIVAEAVRANFLEKMPAEALTTSIKKLAEGPDIVIPDPSEFTNVLDHFLQSHKDFLLAEKGTGPGAWRKVNRLAGLMQAKIGMLRWPKGIHPSIIDGIHGLMEGMIGLVATHDFGNSARVLKTGIGLLAAVKEHLAQRGSRYMWRIYDILGQLGPLSHALSKATDGNKEVVDQKELILVELREIRQLMAKNPDGVTVVAHRGAGPTNRTMGGLIQDADNRRTNRPAENSPEAFGSAYASAGPGGLDGIECDVFLSSDDIPMLSHEGNVREQLTDAQKKIYKGLTEHHEIHDLKAKELVKIQRTGRETSRFMTLWDLLCNTVPVAHEFYESTGKAFRVEVEMKGAKYDPPKVERIVAKTVSKFQKQYTGLPIEIILFNGEPAQVEGYANKRNTKTALGALYTGLGVKTEQLEHGVFETRYIDELRYQFTSEFTAETVDKSDLAFANKYLEQFIATLVFGQEFAPAPVPLEQQPSHALVYKGKADKKGVPTPDFDVKIQAALERYAENPANLEKLKKLHILTDYPRKAKSMKDGLVTASEKALKKANEKR